MQLLEKIVWALTVLVIGAFVLTMVFWRTSGIPDAAIGVNVVKEQPARTGRLHGSGTARGSKAGTRSPGGSAETGGATNPARAAAAYKLRFEPKGVKYKLERRNVDPRFREKYGNSYRDAWEAAHRAESEVIERPDGRVVVRLLSIDKNSMVEKLGFKVGDEITSIQGHDIEEFLVSRTDAYKLGKKLHAELREETDFEVVLDRKDSTMVLYWHVPR